MGEFIAVRTSFAISRIGKPASEGPRDDELLELQFGGVVLARGDIRISAIKTGSRPNLRPNLEGLAAAPAGRRDVIVGAPSWHGRAETPVREIDAPIAASMGSTRRCGGVAADQ